MSHFTCFIPNSWYKIEWYEGKRMILIYWHGRPSLFFGKQWDCLVVLIQFKFLKLADCNLSVSLIHPVQTGIDRSCIVKSQVSVHTTQSSQTFCISVVIAIKKCENVTALDWCLVKLDQNVPPESKLSELVQKIGLLLSLDERHHVVPDKIVWYGGSLELRMVYKPYLWPHYW